MKIVFVAFLLMTVGTSYVRSQVCHMREIDQCTAIGIFQINGIPHDEDNVDEWCEAIKDVEECTDNFFIQCLSPLQREILSLMSGSDEGLKQMCVEGSEMRARYLQHAECLAEVSESGEFKARLRDLQVMIETLFEVPYKQRFSLGCCGFKRFHHSAEEMTRRRCGNSAVEMIQSIVKTIITDLPEIICQKFNPESDQCKMILPAPGTATKKEEDQSQLSKILHTLFESI